ncbi:MAG: M56 family metallopeptidase [Planctomycetales bacterium]|nr:M56 family metallopeptidase [Planctomycetales bacterium]
MNTIVSLCDPWFAWIATYMIHSSVLLIACWAILRSLRSPSHALAERAWKISGTVGLITTVVQLQFVDAGFYALELESSNPIVACDLDVPGGGPGLSSTDSFASKIQWSVRTSADPAINAATTVPQDANDARPQVSMQFSDADQPTVSTSVPANESAAISHAATIWRAKLLKTAVVLSVAFWFAIGMMRLVVSSLILRFNVRRAKQLNRGRPRQLLDQLLKRNNISRRVTLRIDGDHTDPVASGIWRWTIILPAHFEVSLSDDEQQAALAHELAHLVRGDVIWLWVGQCLTACLGFQPMNFVARRQWQQASEYLSDQWAVGHGASQLSLAKSLTTLAGMRLTRKSQALMPAATGTRATLPGRVKRLLGGKEMIDPWQSKARTRLSWCVALLMIVAFPFAVPGVRAATPSDLTARQRDRQDREAGSMNVVVNEQAAVSEIEALIRLDLELAALNAEIGRAVDLADRHKDIDGIAESIATIRTAASSLEEDRNGLSELILQE